MTKRRVLAPIDNTPDLLVKSKKQFATELAEQIRQGEELMQKKVDGPLTLQSLREEHDLWNTFNAEFLKRAFNRTNNQFYQEYTYPSPSAFGFGSVPMQTLREATEETLQGILENLNCLKIIQNKLPLLEEAEGIARPTIQKEENLQVLAINFLSTLFSKFHKVAQRLRHRHGNRDTLLVRDEYDVQDLLHALLLIHFDDVREEDYSPSSAGANSRTDFVLKIEQIVIEVKMTNDHLMDRQIGEQLLIDIGRYRGHPDCKMLVVFVYDKGDNIRNKAGLVRDLEQMSTSRLEVRVFIYPH